MERINITIGSLSFDHAEYDAENDVLYLTWVSRRPARARRHRRVTSSDTRLGLAASSG
jgi:hypothetical protein